jgi:hypothetical protein
VRDLGVDHVTFYLSLFFSNPLPSLLLLACLPLLLFNLFFGLLLNSRTQLERGFQAIQGEKEA